jgi:hypothetical protein
MIGSWAPRRDIRSVSDAGAPPKTFYYITQMGDDRSLQSNASKIGLI